LPRGRRWCLIFIVSVVAIVIVAAILVSYGAILVALIWWVWCAARVWVVPIWIDKGVLVMLCRFG